MNGWKKGGRRGVLFVSVYRLVELLFYLLFLGFGMDKRYIWNSLTICLLKKSFFFKLFFKSSKSWQTLCFCEIKTFLILLHGFFFFFRCHLFSFMIWFHLYYYYHHYYDHHDHQDHQDHIIKLKFKFSVLQISLVTRFTFNHIYISHSHSHLITFTSPYSSHLSDLTYPFPLFLSPLSRS